MPTYMKNITYTIRRDNCLTKYSKSVLTIVTWILDHGCHKMWILECISLCVKDGANNIISGTLLKKPMFTMYKEAHQRPEIEIHNKTCLPRSLWRLTTKGIGKKQITVEASLTKKVQAEAECAPVFHFWNFDETLSIKKFQTQTANYQNYSKLSNIEQELPEIKLPWNS